MQQNHETQQNPLSHPSENHTDNKENLQAETGTEVREGQENSSIAHDENEGNKQLPRDVKHHDISSVNQEEYIEDRNTKK